MKIIGAGLLAVTAFLVSGCDSECCQDVVLTKSVVNEKGNSTPVPIIKGLPATVPCGVTLTADGTASSDPDGEIVNYEWIIDKQKVSNIDTVTTTIPCDGQVHMVCLKVTDDKGATQQTCQMLTIEKDKPVREDICDLELVITPEKADSKQYKFYCTDSTYKGKKIDAATAATCEWHKIKTLLDGTTVKADSTGAVKWVNVDPAKFKSLDLTLTVKNDECEKTITEHYIIQTDLPY